MSHQPPAQVDLKQSRPSVRITLPAIYAEVLKQNKANARIEGKLDRGLDRIDDHGTRIQDHEVRLRMLEASALSKRAVVATVTGGSALAGAIATLAALLMRH
jgi:hypothetical protein